MGKRTFTVSENTIMDLKDVSKYYHIDIQTIKQFAVIHGIERLKNGYRPYRNKQKRSKRKTEIMLPDETWGELSRQLDKIEYGFEEHIPDGEMIEIFINIELKRFLHIKEDYEKSLDESEEQYNTKSVYPISVSYDVPEFIYDHLKNKQEMMGISDSLMGEHLLLSGICSEYEGTNFDTIDTDADLLNE